MLNQKMNDMLNLQINREYESAYIYKAMAQYFAQKNLNGFRHFYSMQAREEMEHTQKFIDYINEQGGVVELEAVAKPRSDYNSILEIFEEALAHEKLVTGYIHELMDLAKESKDYATEQFLGWYVTEQVEEEDTFTSYVDLLKFLNDDPVSIFMLDGQLGQRK